MYQWAIAYLDNSKLLPADMYSFFISLERKIGMGEEIRLNDLADDLLILNKITIDRLFQLDNCVDCVSLYVFYYKTAKWQKTNIIKANDVYVQKCLKWGKSKLTKVKETLKANGLISIVQRRENGRIVGWYVEVSYLVAQKKTDDIKVKVEESKESPKQEVVSTRSGCENTNALKEKIKCLEKEIEMLKNKKVSKKESFDDLINNFTVDEEVRGLLKEWLKVRKAKRAAMTNRAIELNLNKLNNLANESNMSVKDYLEEVICKGWAAFYKITNYGGNSNAITKGTTKQDLSKYDR